MLRETQQDDLDAILALYQHLHHDDHTPDHETVRAIWQQILQNKDYHLIVNEFNGMIVSSCVCLIVPNLARDGRPFALIENVVTHPDFRGQGFATECLRCAEDIARQNDCYKLMLLTGSNRKETLNLYRNAGYNDSDKTGFVRWLD